MDKIIEAGKEFLQGKSHEGKYRLHLLTVMGT